MAAAGWWLVELWGVREDGGCSCSKGKDCPTPGKHPVKKSWQDAATNNEEHVLSWGDSGEPRNIGLLLGPRSGIIDVEFDSDEGKRFAEDLRLDEIKTPTYRSSRSVHRLFKWDSGLPPAAVRKVRGLEVRIGGGGAAAQSVAPPSKHHSGVVYAWLPGLSPDEAEVQELPERLAAMLWNDDEATGETGLSKPPARVVLDGPIQEGSRNNELYRFAVREAFRIPNIDDATEQADLLLKVSMVNDRNCRPPLVRDEIIAIYRQAIAFRRKCDSANIPTERAVELAATEGMPDEAPAAVAGARSARITPEPDNSMTRWGLMYAAPRNGGDPEWWPGEWTLTIVHSDPREYRITVPAWRVLTQDGTGSVSLTTSQFENPAKVASAVLERTGKVILNENPEEWRSIWMGKPARAGGPNRRPRRAVRGLMSKLMDNAEEEWPGESSLRYVVLASWLMDRLMQAQPPSDEDTPCPTGRATWRQDGTLWFGWNRTWEDIERQHRLVEGERLSIKRRLCSLFGNVPDFTHSKYRHASGKTVSYVVWTRRDLALLESLATEGGRNPSPVEAQPTSPLALPD
jgi:putative DNA primase/helicase